MINKLVLVKSESLDPYYNQAIEASLLSLVGVDTFILYLWANDNTVFVGKNQNAYLECNLDLLEQSGGHLARRLTGGGAVYHDKGNINYTFVAPKSDYNKQRQFGIILNALKGLGIDAQLSGRNDVTVLGKKFSGNAFYTDNNVGLHHGTLLINSNYSLIAKYLSVSKLKLISKGVSSVESRVINLTEIKKDTNKQEISDAIIDACSNEFGKEFTYLSPEAIDKELFTRWHSFFSDTKHQKGDNVYYDVRLEQKYDWGIADIRLKLNGQTVTHAKIYSDSLDIDLIEQKQQELIGCDISKIKRGE